MSIVTYNGITLPYADTIKFRQEAVRDHGSNTDWYLTKFDISVQCLINSDYLNLLAPDLTGKITNPADIMQMIRSRLLRHRRSLSVTFNGRELIPQPQAGLRGIVDADNGPKPQDCTYVQLTNNLFLMRYSITAHYWENVDPNEAPPNNQLSNPVLYNRWSESVDIDNKNYSTRTREGKLIIRSDNARGWVADEVRSQMAVVGVPGNSFLRQRSYYRVDPSGLGLEYRVVDQEVFRKPPEPAFAASGYYRESTSINGAIRHGETFVHLEGDKNTPRDVLIRTCIAVASQKMTAEGERITGKVGRGFEIIPSAALHLDLYKNDVEFSIRAFIGVDPVRIDANASIFGVKVQTKIYPNPLAGFNVGTETPQSTPLYTPNYQDRGTANLFLRAAAYYDPNLINNRLAPDNTTVPNQATSTGQSAKVQMLFGVQPGEAGKKLEP